MRRLGLTTLAVVTALGLAACDDGESTPDTDAGPGGGIDAGPGGGVDAGPGGGVDAGPGSGVDAGPGSGVDAGPGSGGDASMPTVTGGIGSACTGDGDCEVGPSPTCQTEVGSGSFSYEFPGGYCSSECSMPSDCGPGADCYMLGFGGFGVAFCAKTCTSNADCREDEGYACMAPPAGGGSTMYCLPPFGGGGFGDGGFGLGDGGLPFP